MSFAESFTPLDSKLHNVKGFSCGKATLDDFISRYAAKNMKLGVSNTWVLTVQQNKPSGKAPIAAYYTLTPSAVKPEVIPFDKKLPNYPVPVILLARLAVDQKYSGQGLGEKTLITALRKSVDITTTGLNAVGVIIDVLDEDALNFYNHFDLFSPFTDNPMRLFAPISVLKQI
ncbi:GNAT family N-acetyltransferase [Thiohalophilus sp.]|uniref:GNAT family N-acetyltransferase n=1 Tax=Thiohalophilus sp. TaxID=3028392 RepID=UPI002ACDA698|nr:GNAT family N-acetyltransferase [Thiohalophilus sp.]MDZ7662067.1 GNAT family N-acetyltransferase [Thiohalophilus sp.]